jgi:predicted aldo/keto reductase-like oxidoreductase
MEKKLIIGTVQFGIDYGITNSHGKIKLSDIDNIFKYCYENNIYYFDTAQDYGNSEDIISKYSKKYEKFNIITKSKFKNKNIEDTLKISFDKFNIIECLDLIEDFKSLSIVNKYTYNIEIRSIYYIQLFFSFQEITCSFYLSALI